ncbi:MAG TPA: polysaccharide biosynthesis tyrosine autokinase [Chitinophagaceae bacterium]|nr:polysaccharide biosynthesis tyrosine autokinase [Chitinophagaceae bacterium]
MSNFEFDQERNQSFDLFKHNIKKYFKKWPYVVICVILFLIVAQIKLRYSTPIYQASSLVHVNTEMSNSALDFSSSLDLSGTLTKSRVEDEIEIFRSVKLIQRAVVSLNLQVNYRSVGKVKSPDLYGISPVRISSDRDFDFVLDSLKKTSYSFTIIGDKNKDEVEVHFEDKIIQVKNNEEFASPLGNIKVEKLHDFNGEIKASVRHSNSIARDLRSKLSIKVHGNYASKILELKMLSDNKIKAEIFLEEIVKQYNQDAIEDKNAVLTNTARFIDEQLEIISADLSEVETEKAQFKSSRGLIDIGSEASTALQEQREALNKAAELGVQIHLLSHTLNSLNKSIGHELLPVDVGVQEQGLNNQIANYNNLVLEKSRLESSATSDNPILIQLNSKLDALKNSLSASIQTTINSIGIKQAEFQKHAERVSSKIAASPRQEMLMRGIVREQELKESLYIFLLQRRTEVGISLAISTPVAKVINQAQASGSPVSPNKNSIYFIAIVLGIAVPIGFFFLKDLLDNKVRNQEDIKRTIHNATVLGEVPSLKSKDAHLITKNDRSVLAEAFRIIYTNLKYMIPESVAGKAPIIYVSSTIAGEGKTLAISNLAKTLYYNNKKVVLVGADLRNPQLKSHFEERTLYGLSDYLFNEEIQIADIITKIEEHEGMDIIHAGNIPPNPAELLTRNRWEMLLRQLQKEYDYVLVDTAPMLLVTDTLVINKYADLIVYLIRAGKTEKNLLNFINDIRKEKKVENVGFILNDVKAAGYGYGNKYGYGYGNVEKKNIFKKLFNS